MVYEDNGVQIVVNRLYTNDNKTLEKNFFVKNCLIDHQSVFNIYFKLIKFNNVSWNYLVFYRIFTKW